MKKERYKDAKDKRPPGGFVPLPHIVVRSAQWAALSPFAVKLLVELLGQYSGNNNGNLTTAWTVLRPRGWKSKATLSKAIDELESRAWIQRTSAATALEPNSSVCTPARRRERAAGHAAAMSSTMLSRSPAAVLTWLATCNGRRLPRARPRIVGN
jgi:hypothetical protein